MKQHMPPQRMMDFLYEIGLHNADHSGRTLLDHLLGTYRLLLQWGGSESLCSAGLFHSIYGTADYVTSSLSIEKRTTLIDVIGSEAEQLVYEFARRGHRELLYLSSKLLNPHLCDSRLHDLLELCTANFVEQAPSLDREFLNSIMHRDVEQWKSSARLVSSSARKQIENLLTQAGLHLSN